MTLWDILVAYIRRRWQHRRRRRLWMTAWPYWSKQPRFNIIERYLIRRGVWLLVIIVLFRVNPLHPLTIGITLLGLSLVTVEHRTHRQQQALLYNTKGKGFFR